MLRPFEIGTRILSLGVRWTVHGILVLAATYGAAQIATGIHLQDVRFTGDTRLDGVDFNKCTNDFKSQVYVGTDWTDYFVGVVRTKCLVNNGYFKAAVTASTRQLRDRKSTHQFAITFNIDAGPRYSLEQITFQGNHAISDQKALRDLFPLKDGSILDRLAIADGLERLRTAYGELGYINFTPVPSLTFDDDKKLAFLQISLDEGKQFHVGSIGVVGADPQVLDDLPLSKGQVYNARLINIFLEKHLPGASENDERVVQRSLDERNGTVALVFDFRRHDD